MKRIALLALLVLAASALAPADAWGGPRRPGAHGAAGPRARIHRHRRHARALLARLELSAEQRDLVRSLRAETQDVRTDLAARVREVLSAARGREDRRSPEARRAVREEVRAAVRAAAERVAPQSDRVLGSFTAEQRQRISDAAARRGKDGDRAARRVATTLLLGPGPRGPAAHGPGGRRAGR